MGCRLTVFLKFAGLGSRAGAFSQSRELNQVSWTGRLSPPVVAMEVTLRLPHTVTSLLTGRASVVVDVRTSGAPHGTAEPHAYGQGRGHTGR